MYWWRWNLRVWNELELCRWCDGYGYSTREKAHESRWGWPQVGDVANWPIDNATCPSESGEQPRPSQALELCGNSGHCSGDAGPHLLLLLCVAGAAQPEPALGAETTPWRRICWRRSSWRWRWGREDEGKWGRRAWGESDVESGWSGACVDGRRKCAYFSCTPSSAMSSSQSSTWPMNLTSGVFVHGEQRLDIKCWIYT